jgi:hypothetical protein
MLRKFGTFLTTGAILATAGCLQKDTTHTVYLAPDGSASWQVSETDVYSDANDIDKRVGEEQQFIAAALLGTHGAARGLAALHPLEPVRTTVLRDERPFHVVTAARFSAVDRTIERFFVEMGIRTSASVVHESRQTTLRVHLDFSHPLDDRKTEVSELLDDIERLRLVLTEGRFGAVSGFDVTDQIVATVSKEWMASAELAHEAKAPIALALSWSTE